MQRKCLKCNKINDNATGDPLESCPVCGAIYSRVEAAWANREAGASPPSRFGPSSRLPTPSVDIATFADAMRRDSLYPTFRSLVRVFYLLWLFLAVCAVVGGLAMLILGTGSMRLWGLIGGAFWAVFFFIVARLTREMSLMLADLSDAAVRMAARQEGVAA